MASTRPTAQQLAFFETFGFLTFPGLLADRIQQITDEFEAIWAATGGHNGSVHDRTARSCSVQFIDQSVYLATPPHSPPRSAWRRCAS